MPHPSNPDSQPKRPSPTRHDISAIPCKLPHRPHKRLPYSKLPPNPPSPIYMQPPSLTKPAIPPPPPRHHAPVSVPDAPNTRRSFRISVKYADTINDKEPTKSRREPPPVPVDAAATVRRSQRCKEVEQVKLAVGFYATLSKEEIEEDFIAMTGTKPPARPSKRPKVVQERLQGLLLGSKLSRFITPASHGRNR